ncbi:MAG TPA: oligosaccharide flippase family protein [Acidobacteriaceae bacterium]
MNLTGAYQRTRGFIRDALKGEALRAKAMRGGAWLGSGSVAEQAARFARNMLLTRLLAPNAFGTMAIVLSSASVVQTLTDVGERAAIIQSPHGDEPRYLNASWWLGFARVAVCYAIICALAPWIAHFYGRPELSGLLRLALVSVLFNGAMSPRCALIQRHMKLGRWAVITNGGGLCGVAITVILSFFMRDVWALAIGYCSEDASRFVLSYIICPGRPRLRIDWHATRELLNFSRGVFGMAPLNLIINRSDIFVLGRLFSLSSLGLYSMAVNLVATPSVFITNMLGQTLLPAMSGIHQDTERLNRILLEVTSWLALLGLPATLLVALSAPSMLRLAYGARYAAAAGPLAVAAGVVLLTVLNSLLTTLLFSRGVPGVHRSAIAITAVVMLAAVYPAAKLLGPVGAQIAALAANAIGYLYQILRLRFLTGLRLSQYGSTFLAPALGCLAALAVVLASRRLAFAARPIPDLVLSFVCCTLVAAACATAHLRTWNRQSRAYSRKDTESAAAL